MNRKPTLGELKSLFDEKHRLEQRLLEMQRLEKSGKMTESIREERDLLQQQVQELVDKLEVSDS
jgi:hypothetical protein